MYIQENKNFKIYNPSGDRGVKSTREFYFFTYVYPSIVYRLPYKNTNKRTT